MARQDRLFSSALMCLLFFGSSTTALAQFERANTGVLTAGATANYRYAEASELAINVTLVGAVARPGRYEVSPKVDLVELIALAGGWNENADMTDVHITREKTPNDSVNRFTIKVNLENLSEISPRFLGLQDGDCIVIGKTAPVTLPVVLSIISTAATVVMAVSYFTVANR